MNGDAQDEEKALFESGHSSALGAPERTFVVHPGNESDALREGIEVMGLRALMQILAQASGHHESAAPRPPHP